MVNRFANNNNTLETLNCARLRQLQLAAAVCAQVSLGSFVCICRLRACVSQSNFLTFGFADFAKLCARARDAGEDA